MSKYKVIPFILILFSGLGLQGCLTFEAKEYSFKLKDGNSGEGKIKYINIMRTKDSLGSVESDYQSLIETYLKGNKPEDEFMGVKNVKKRLFEEDNRLCGEITFDFEDITKIKFFNYKDKVWCYYIGSAQMNIFGSSESYFSSNGTYGGELMPVVFWDDNQKKFELKTVSTEPSDNTTSLLDIWKQKGE
jgi:hypothetical protein